MIPTLKLLIGNLIKSRCFVTHSQLEVAMTGLRQEFEQKFARLQSAVTGVVDAVKTEGDEINFKMAQMQDEIASLKTQVGESGIDFSGLDALTESLEGAGTRIKNLVESLETTETTAPPVADNTAATSEEIADTVTGFETDITATSEGDETASGDATLEGSDTTAVSTDENSPTP